jgi:Tol biopolymer transport system component
VARPRGCGKRETLTPLRKWSQLANREGQEYGVFDAHWSPDRKQLGISLASWCADPCSQLATISLPDGKLHKIGKPRGDSVIAWSADGLRLLYEELFYSGREGIWTISLRPGAKETRLNPALSRSLAKLSVGSFRLSPDESNLAVESDGLLLIDLIDEVKRRVTTTSSDDIAGWSPDGQSLLFNRDGDAYTVNANGSGLRRLTSDQNSHPIDWSPDGKHLLFLRAVENRSELWVMDADGSGQTRLPFNRPGLSIVTADWSAP